MNIWFGTFMKIPSVLRFSLQGRWERMILAIWIAHPILLIFVTNLQKTWITYAYSWISSLLPHKSQYAFIPLPVSLYFITVCTLWMTIISKKKLDKSMSRKTRRVCIIKKHCSNKSHNENNFRFVLSTFQMISVQILR